MAKAHNKGKGAAIAWIRAHVDHQGDDCLIWPFSCARGYPSVSLDGNVLRAHRVMCALSHGEPPTPNHQTAHSCGRGHCGCIHPEHLSWKTNGENQLDRRIHGTKNKGGHRYIPKLTAEQVYSIRAMREEKTQDELAEQFGTCRRNIGAILSGKTWRHLPSPT